ncbi:MAG TPA: hypothetical protein VFP85_03250 [Vicinamibacterales bacterium]|nr:hypothetical protein [Vicinamibacterales bacterium]
MRRGMWLLMVVAFVAASAGPILACGDKFLGAGRGPRFSKVYAAVYPGRLLMYMPPGELATMKGLDKALRRAGHEVMIAKDLPTFTKALQDRAVDIVLVDNAHVAEAGGVAKEIAAKPSVVPVSKSAIGFLKTLDETMKTRLSLRPFSGGGASR